MNETVALVGLAVVLAKTLEKLVDFVLSKFKKQEKDSGYNLKSQIEAIQMSLKELSDILNKTDINGARLIYVPRNIETRLLELLNMQSDQAHSQENTIKILDKMTDRVIDAASKQDQILHEVRK